MNHFDGLNVVTSSSSGDEERLTIVYTESNAKSDSTSFTTEESSTSSSDYTSSSWESSDKSSILGPLDKLRAKEEDFGYEPVWRTMSMSEGPKIHALDYFRSHCTFQLFSFLISHLLAHTPDKPIPFLIDLVDKCLLYRDRGGDPPVLFEDSHILSLYTALDPANEGTITYKQYVTAMTTLNLSEFDLMPPDLTNRLEVPKQVFLDEAKKALLNQLDRILGRSQPVVPSSSETLDVDLSATNVDEETSKVDTKEVGIE